MKYALAAAAMALGVTAALAAQSRPDPYAGLPPVSLFSLASTDVANGKELPLAQWSGAFGVPGGKDISPQLSWSNVPAGTKSFVVTMFDPDAPTPHGFWHWILVDVPATATSLPAGAGSADGKLLPPGAWQLPNDPVCGSRPPGRHGQAPVLHRRPSPRRGHRARAQGCKPRVPEPQPAGPRPGTWRVGGDCRAEVGWRGREPPVAASGAVV